MRFFDAHCDTLTKIFDSEEQLLDNSRHLSLKRLKEDFQSPVQVFAVWTEPLYYNCALERALKVIDYYYKEAEKNKDIFGHVNNIAELRENEKNGKISGILAIEGGEPLCGSTEILRTFYRLGVRVLSLTWNYRNELAWGIKDEAPGHGLTQKGRAVLREMEALGMAPDVSHLSDKGFYELAEAFGRPFLATHSNARSICPNPRNLTDSQIKIISERGGVIGLNIYPEFLGENADIPTVLKHAEHILDVGGGNSLGMGCDFDGVDVLPEGIENVSHVNKIFEAFEREFGREQTEKIAWGNFMNFFEKLLA